MLRLNTMILLSSLAFAALAPVRAFSATNVVPQWDEVAVQSIIDVKMGPPYAARALAIVHTCIYDTWSAYDSTALDSQFLGAMRRPAAEGTDANKAEAVSFAAFKALKDLFPQPAEIAKFSAMMTSLGYDSSNASVDTSTPAGLGNTMCAAVLNFRHSDGSNQLGDIHAGPYTDYTGYVPSNTFDAFTHLNLWQPLQIPTTTGSLVVQTYLGAQWGNVVPFALEKSVDGLFIAPPPAKYYRKPVNSTQRKNTAAYIAQAQALVDISAGLTPKQKMIAEYWADNAGTQTPPGHWCRIAQYISSRDGHTLDDDAKMFFALSNALMDAGIAAWNTKRIYNSERPISAIHYLFAKKTILSWGGPGKGTRSIRGTAWRPYQSLTVVTPPFPEHVSGHSAFSAAAAAVLESYTGSDDYGNSITVPIGGSQFEPGLPSKPVTLTWPTFTAASLDAGMSRLYGGIHFANGNIQGRLMGGKVGAKVWLKALYYFNGTLNALQ